MGEWPWLDRHGRQVDVSKFGPPITHRHAAMASRRGDLTVRAAPSDFESQHGLAPLDSGSRRKRLSLSQLGSCEYSAEQSPISGSPSRRLSDRPTAESPTAGRQDDAHRSAAAAASAVLMLCGSALDSELTSLCTGSSNTYMLRRTCKCTSWARPCSSPPADRGIH